jgi:hypothetical protein
MPGIAAACAMGIGLLLVVSVATPQPKTNSVTEYPSPLVREQQTVVVNGVSEVWQLRWRAIPEPMCEPSDVSLTCPCMGFAYGEAGDLDLIRLRGTIEIDRLAIGPLFAQIKDQGDKATIQRWEPNFETDFKASEQSDFSERVSKRPTVQIMRIADYDHDGFKSEFYLQTEAIPCGKSAGVVIGVSRSNPRLHVFGTASKPDKPLYMKKTEWDAVRDAHGPIEVDDWTCGDHGSDTQITLRLRWTAKGIDGSRREFACPPGRKAEGPIHEEPL